MQKECQLRRGERIMGTYQERYFILQIWDYPEERRKLIEEFDLHLKSIEEPYKSLFKKIERIANGGVDYFIGYSGSKEGWDTNEEAKKIIIQAINKCNEIGLNPEILEIIPRGDIYDDDCIRRDSR